MVVSEPVVGAALGVGSVLCVSGRGTTWSTVTTQTTQTYRQNQVLCTYVEIVQNCQGAQLLASDAWSEWSSDILCVAWSVSAAISLRVSIYLWLLSGVPPGLVVLGQQQLLVEQVHPLLPLDVQSGTHSQGRLVAWLGALMNTDVNNTLISRQKKTKKNKNQQQHVNSVKKICTADQRSLKGASRLQPTHH